MVNFRKRWKVCEIIDNIKRWQLQPHNFRSIPSVLNFIEESLNSSEEPPDVDVRLWNTPLRQELLEDEERRVQLLEEFGI
jgi:son of sevenless-like protein